MISGIAILGENADEYFPPIINDQRKDACPVAKITGRVGMEGFFMNVGGPALPNISWGAENTSYLDQIQGFKAASPALVVSNTWASVYLTYRYTT